MVDLVWHTHQLFPRRYAAECAAIVGHEVRQPAAPSARRHNNHGSQRLRTRGCNFARQVDHDDTADPEGDGLAAALALTGRLWATAFATPYPAEEGTGASVEG